MPDTFGSTARLIRQSDLVSISTRIAIWRSVNARCLFRAGLRMLEETMRVVCVAETGEMISQSSAIRGLTHGLFLNRPVFPEFPVSHSTCDETRAA